MAGFDTTDDYRFILRNTLGDIVLAPSGSVDVLGTLKINGKSVSDTYVSVTAFAGEMSKKVDAVKGKQLSTEDFTTEYKKKLAAITTGELTGGGDGYVTAGAVRAALKMKLSADENLSDIMNKSAARKNLDVYSKTEAGEVFLKTSEGLKELVRLTAEEINRLPAEEAAALKAEKQAAMRDTLDAERKGTGDLKLAKLSNLSDLSDKNKARKNLEVYSKTEIDTMMAGKLGTDSAYQGIVFTAGLRDKLQAITTGSFAYTDSNGTSHAQVEGYVMTSQVVGELKKKADRLLGGYSASEKETVAMNLNLYTKAGADARFATLENLFQDYINFLVRQGKSTSEAQQFLQGKLNVLSKNEIVRDYLRRDSKLSDLLLPTETVIEKAKTLESIVTFRQGSSKVDVSQLPNVERIASYMNRHPESKVVIKGYSSPEGSIEVNERIARARAESVKSILAKKYRIDNSSITAEGQGIGDMFSEPDWNRVSICTLQENK